MRQQPITSQLGGCGAFLGEESILLVGELDPLVSRSVVTLLWKWHYAIWDPRKTFSRSCIALVWSCLALVLRWTRTGASATLQCLRRVLSRYVQHWCTVPFLNKILIEAPITCFRPFLTFRTFRFIIFGYFVLLNFAILNCSQHLRWSGHALFWGSI